MLFREIDNQTGTSIYMVCNDQGSCLIRTSSSHIAFFVESHAHKINPNLRLIVGGDPGSKSEKRPIFHHIRKYSR